MEAQDFKDETQRMDATHDYDINGSTNAIEILEPALTGSSDEISTALALDIFNSKTLLELGKTTWRNTKNYEKSRQPYIRGCAWSPDGTCCLSVVNSDGLHITELPRDLYEGEVSSRRDVDLLSSVIHVKESGLMYDFCWYPGMNSALPETCCWLTSRQHGPLQLWDAFDGGLRCSYRGYDAVDEMEPALSCAFSTDGAEIYAGYRKCIRTFHTSRPGRDCSTHSLKAPASCLVASGKLLAVGSWNTSIGLYSINETGTLKSIGKMHGHSGGVTHAKFTADGLKLISGARKDDRILVWDLRFYRRPLNILPRRVDTNQRIYFDVSPCGRYLVSGGTDGMLRVWDSVTSEWSSASAGSCDDAATYQFQLHEDCCNSISIHPFRPIIATGSGQYHSRNPIMSLGDSSDDITDQLESTVNQSDMIIDQSERTVDQSERTVYQSERTVDQSERTVDQSERSVDQSDVEVSGEVKCDNSLVFWWIGSVSDL